MPATHDVLADPFYWNGRSVLYSLLLSNWTRPKRNDNERESTSIFFLGKLVEWSQYNVLLLPPSWQILPINYFQGKYKSQYCAVFVRWSDKIMFRTYFIKLTATVDICYYVFLFSLSLNSSCLIFWGMFANYHWHNLWSQPWASSQYNC